MIQRNGIRTRSEETRAAKDDFARGLRIAEQMRESYEIARSLLGDSFESCTADIRSYLERRMAQRGESIIAAIYALVKALDKQTILDSTFLMLMLATGFHMHMEELTKSANKAGREQPINADDSPAEASVLRQPPGKNQN